mmetsp:Transcript_76114/g.211605  ORF Transcript_76114/g.211605 Transcript_76114/m.211605 type:complete len:271 (+) Transcript_76114:103-915(+)
MGTFPESVVIALDNDVGSFRPESAPGNLVSPGSAIGTEAADPASNVANPLASASERSALTLVSTMLPPLTGDCGDGASVASSASPLLHPSLSALRSVLALPLSIPVSAALRAWPPTSSPLPYSCRTTPIDTKSPDAPSDWAACAGLVRASSYAGTAVVASLSSSETLKAIEDSSVSNLRTSLSMISAATLQRCASRVGASNLAPSEQQAASTASNRPSTSMCREVAVVSVERHASSMAAVRIVNSSPPVLFVISLGASCVLGGAPDAGPL